MSDIDSMLAQRAQNPASQQNIDSMLQAKVSGAQQAPIKSNSAAPTQTERLETGVMDPVYGLAQLAEHTLTTPLNIARAGIRAGLNSVGANGAADLFQNVSSDDFDNIVQQRESDYQQARQAAGQTGIDWTRLAGNAASLAATGFAGAPESIAGRIGVSAAQGGIAGATTASTTPGDFWWDKVKNIGTGLAAGGATSGLVESITPGIKAAITGARNYFGANAGNTAAAEAIVNDSLNAKGVDPNTIDLNILGGLKKEVQSVLDSGGNPDSFSPAGVGNRAIAESLPYPMNLTKGMANRDREQFLNEQNLMDIQGVGKPIAQRMDDLNTAAVNNLKSLSGNTETNAVTTGQQITQKIQDAWNNLQNQKEQLYNAVKNHQGLSATVDSSIGTDIRETLGSPEAMHAWMTLPSHIQNTIHDIESGDLPLTVSNLQALDKAWGADAAAADGSSANAINTARQMLSNAPLSDDVGDDAMKAYQLAKQAHAQQMSLIQPKLLNGRVNPNYQPLMKSVVVDGKAPETIFNSGFTNATTNDAAKNMIFLNSLDPSMPNLISNTYMGEIGRDAINANGLVSAAKLNSYANSPIEMMKMETIAGKPATQTFKNLSTTWNNVKTIPGGINLGNPSGTGQSVLNTALTVGKGLSKLPVIKQVLREPLMDTAQEAAQKGAVKEALNPGVTLKSVLTSPKQAQFNRIASGVGVPLAAAFTQKQNPSQSVSNED